MTPGLSLSLVLVGVAVQGRRHRRGLRRSRQALLEDEGRNEEAKEPRETQLSTRYLVGVSTRGLEWAIELW